MAWHTYLDDPTLADAILGRIVHSSHWIDLKGATLRNKKKEKQGETARLLKSVLIPKRVLVAAASMTPILAARAGAGAGDAKAGAHQRGLSATYSIACVR